MTGSRVSDVAAQFGATRLCHFTPSINLPHIIRDGTIRPTARLVEDVRACYAPTDLERLDGQAHCVCASVEYPNVYYLAKAGQRGRLAHFTDWTVLLLPLTLLDRPGALFAPRNAAAMWGRLLAPHSDGFARLYASEVVGTSGYSFVRGPRHLPAAPTDMQAEVLIPGEIDLTEVLGVVFATETQARSEFARLAIAGLSLGQIPVRTSSALFSRDALRGAIQTGRRPEEREWDPNG